MKAEKLQVIGQQKLADAFVHAWQKAAEWAAKANEAKDALREMALAQFFHGRDGDTEGPATVEVEGSKRNVNVTFANAYRAISHDELQLLRAISPRAARSFVEVASVSISDLSEAELKCLADMFGDRVSVKRAIVPDPAWHDERHTLPAETLIQIEQQLRLERVLVSVAK